MRKHCHLWIIAAVMLLGGCFPFKGESGRRVDDASLRGIIAEMTGKDELYTLCGWPRAIMLPDETALVGIVPQIANMPFNRRVYRVDTAAYYELFARRRTLGEMHQIVYYEHLTSHYYEGLFSHGEATADRLWVLVNEGSGLVEDYAYKKHGEPTIFAGDAPSVPR